jgi:hypothetical protein
VLTKEFCGPLPRQAVPASTAIEPLAPEAPGTPIEPKQTAVVRRSPVILVVASELGVEDLLLLVHRIVPVFLTPLGNRFQAPTEPFAHPDPPLPSFYLAR